MLLKSITKAFRHAPRGATIYPERDDMLGSKSKTKAKHHLVVHLNDGSRRKGVADSFDPARASFLLKEIDVAGNMIAVHDIDMQTVHAAFFVHDLALMRTSRHTYRDAPATQQRLSPEGKRLRVTFTWGEVLDGMSYDYEPRVRGYFLYPLGPLNRAYNIEKVYVSRKAIARVEVLPSS